jgi:hypothetical protein
MGDNETDNNIGVDAVGDSDSDIDGDEIEMAIFRNFYDFEAIGPIDSDVDAIDEVKSFCDIAQAVFKSDKKAEVNNLCGQIFNIYAMKFFLVNL